ncbi:TPA: YydG family radical SAM peptide epimerase [Staphylococcus aureus]|uniref:YydG family radical SAM peptide epimerase n=2 Tax=Staphylococcus aureus TaxID=1280 RepID=UPI00093044A0|nr:YydG family radical SAM peptide epimerase [Staphylococcus aureus]WQJ27043.1 YydG family radical SAM peptide epimerase [Staphylococcus aureus]WQJ29713.1 YydG family radical SAM peptide epimerase [Staphylococcus aureus]WQJ36993.1 YydG family radical SAM peptide epimerase [Staphylococcus aureus]WQJ60664.1 YydG family radical SAM peptide epimerase [Staphylococcus aureus]WQJ68372.1 YydG family radical SAM peptide epimerase [Staphylococcus aureus]
MYNKSVSINLDSKCNASCDHCCFSCSPFSSVKMEDSYIRTTVLEFAKNSEIDLISFTGGEIFLNYGFLEELLMITKNYNKKVTLISNGFWGSSRKLVRKYFSDFMKYNVVALTISYDEYHEPFVKVNSVKRIFEYSRYYPNVEVSLNMAVTKNKMSNIILSDLGSSILGKKITKFPMISVGAAKDKINEKDIHNFYNIKKDKNMLYCPGYEIVYHHDGEIYPCCSPAIFETQLSLRESKNQSFERTVEKLNSNLLLYIIRKEGFNWFLDILKEKSLLDTFEIPENFPSVCSICGSLFNTTEKINFFKPYMERYYNETVNL